jgi:hypothetical protein
MQMNESKKRKNCDPFLPLKSCLPRPEKARTTSYSLAAAQFACPRRDMLTMHPHLLPVLSSFYMDRLKWVDRTLAPSTDPRLVPSLLERLMGTPCPAGRKSGHPGTKVAHCAGGQYLVYSRKYRAPSGCGASLAGPLSRYPSRCARTAAHRFVRPSDQPSEPPQHVSRGPTGQVSALAHTNNAAP